MLRKSIRQNLTTSSPNTELRPVMISLVIWWAGSSNEEFLVFYPTNLSKRQFKIITWVCGWQSRNLSFDQATFYLIIHSKHNSLLSLYLFIHYISQWYYTHSSIVLCRWYGYVIYYNFNSNNINRFINLIKLLKCKGGAQSPFLSWITLANVEAE